MSVRLRLRRTGTRNKACFRVVAADQRSPRDGRFIEVLGIYDPRHEDERVNLERVDYWLSQGAQPSSTVSDIIRRCRAKADGTLAPPAPEPAAAEAVEEAPAEEAPVEEAPADEAPAAEAPADEAAEAPAAEEAPADEAPAEDK